MLLRTTHMAQNNKQCELSSKFYLTLQSPQPVVKVSAFSQMFNHTIHSKKGDVNLSTLDHQKKKRNFTATVLV